SWSGSDGLNGSGSSVTKYYSTNGEKSAIVTITSADGKTGTHACSNQLAVRNVSNTYAYVAPIKSSNSGSQTQSQTNQNGQTQTQTNNQDGSQTQATAQNGAQAQTASALFSLNNVPWGWVAMLVILVLFATVLYMLFNRQKI
ncbi:MAG: hypothetical protein NTZ38_01960, partial [Candidatus Taylorbacteria bacterium]|nr:hypothetical protein [Candidatus Taylorbacteria bacterium]